MSSTFGAIRVADSVQQGLDIPPATARVPRREERGKQDAEKAEADQRTGNGRAAAEAVGRRPL